MKVPGAALPPEKAVQEELIQPVLSLNYRRFRFVRCLSSTWEAIKYLLINWPKHFSLQTLSNFFYFF